MYKYVDVNMHVFLESFDTGDDALHFVGGVL